MMLPRAQPVGLAGQRGAAFTNHLALGRPGQAPSQRHDVGAAVTAITGVAATNLLTKAAHGFTGGENVVVTALTGGAGLPTGGGLFVLFVSSSTFRLARVPGGAEVDFTTDITAMTLQRVSSSAPVKQRSGRQPARVLAPRHGD